MRVWPVRRVRVTVAGAVAVGLAVGALVAVASETWWIGALVAAGLGGALGGGWTRKWRRRRSLVAEPFPERWREILQKRVSFYRRLQPEGRARFEDDVRIFLAEQNIVAARVPSFEIAEETPLLIAASAAMLGHGLPDWEWNSVRDIVVHPSSFDEDYEEGGHVAGLVHHQGPVVFSQRDLRHGFRRGTDGFNPGVHELAHVMDLADGYADGVPAGWFATAPWLEVMHDRLARVRRGDATVPLRDYAGVNEAELFAVAVEAFFERPRKLADKDPELYATLRSFFNQDPASKSPSSPDSTAS